jgi:nucleoside-diphosphate-sugar epimerase
MAVPEGRLIEDVVGDLTDLDAVRRAVAGADVVFHVAAVVDWGQASYESLYKVTSQTPT